MPPRKTLLLVVDGLSIRDLGAYGNTWIPTPSIDRLAVGSLLFEHVLTQSIEPADMLTSLVGPQRETETTSSLIGNLRSKGIATAALSDTAATLQKAFSADEFDRVFHVEPSEHSVPAADWDQTHCAEFFAELLRVAGEMPDEYFLLAYFGGLTRCWDAPLDLRNRFVEEGDSEPLSATEPPQAHWSQRDPDQQVRLYQAMAAEIIVFDTCLGTLWDELCTEAGVRLILMAPRGYPLGEHGRVGWSSPSLYSEGTAVPLLIADSQNAVGWRSQQLVSPTIVRELIEHDEGLVFGDLAQRFVASEDRILICRNPNQRAIRTKNWFLIQSDDKAELYVKPDDRWEFNDVSSRCPAIVEELQRHLDSSQQSSISPRK